MISQDTIPSMKTIPQPVIARLSKYLVCSQALLRGGKEGIDIGIITVPFEAAQQVADLLIAAGIRGILNLSLTHIAAPERVHVVERRLVVGMLELVHAIKQDT